MDDNVPNHQIPIVFYGSGLNSKCLAHIINLSGLNAEFIIPQENYDFESVRGKTVYVCEFNYKYPYDLHTIASKVTIVGCHRNLIRMWTRIAFSYENVELVLNEDMDNDVTDIEIAWKHFCAKVPLPAFLDKIVNLDVDTCVYMRTFPYDITKWPFEIEPPTQTVSIKLISELVAEAQNLSEVHAKYYLHSISNNTLFIVYINTKNINPFLLEETELMFPQMDCLACWYYDELTGKTFYKLYSATIDVSAITEKYQGSGSRYEAEMEYSGNDVIYPMDFQKVATFDIIDVINNRMQKYIKFKVIVGRCALLKINEAYCDDYIRPNLMNFIQRKCNNCLFIMFQIVLTESSGDTQYEYRLFVNDRYIASDDSEYAQLMKLGLFAGSIRHVSFRTHLEFDDLPLQIDEDDIVNINSDQEDPDGDVDEEEFNEKNPYGEDFQEEVSKVAEMITLTDIDADETMGSDSDESVISI
jgi:hypothetical protein